MRPVTPSTNPAATLRLVILSLIARGSFGESDLPRVVGLAGGTWKPSRDVIFDALEELVATGCVRQNGETLSVTAKAHETIRRLLSGYRPGFLGDADVIACATVLPLLPPEGRQTVHALLDAHWRAEHAWWEAAAQQCPCEIPTIRRLIERRVAEAAIELAHLDDAAAVARSCCS